MNITEVQLYKLYDLLSDKHNKSLPIIYASSYTGINILDLYNMDFRLRSNLSNLFKIMFHSEIEVFNFCGTTYLRLIHFEEKTHYKIT